MLPATAPPLSILSYMDMICSFSRDYHQTIILVTHDPEMASYADRIVTLIDGEIVRNQLNNKESKHHEA